MTKGISRTRGKEGQEKDQENPLSILQKSMHGSALNQCPMNCERGAKNPDRACEYGGSKHRRGTNGCIPGTTITGRALE